MRPLKPRSRSVCAAWLPAWPAPTMTNVSRGAPRRDLRLGVNGGTLMRIRWPSRPAERKIAGVEIVDAVFVRGDHAKSSRRCGRSLVDERPVDDPVVGITV